MGNNPSAAAATMFAKSKMDEINGRMAHVPKTEAPETRRERQNRHKQREKEYQIKKLEREQKKSQMNQKWSTHRASNGERQNEQGGPLANITGALQQAGQSIGSTVAKTKENTEGWWGGSGEEAGKNNGASTQNEKKAVSTSDEDGTSGKPRGWRAKK